MWNVPDVCICVYIGVILLYSGAVIISRNSTHFIPTKTQQGSWCDTLSSWGGLESSLMKMACKSNERCVFPGTIRQQLLFWPGSSVDKRKLLPLRSRKSAFQVLLCLKSVGGQGSAWLLLSAERSWHGMISYIRQRERERGRRGREWQGHSTSCKLWWSGRNKNNYKNMLPEATFLFMIIVFIITIELRCSSLFQCTIQLNLIPCDKMILHCKVHFINKKPAHSK